MIRKNNLICRLLVIATTVACSLNICAQNLPTDGFPWIDNGTGTGTPWAGDTIIIRRTTIGTGGMGQHAPACSSDICAIYKQGYIFITINNEVSLIYAVRNEDMHFILRGQATASAAYPAILDLTTLPSGHYTLLLYINNECLEGEFEKE